MATPPYLAPGVVLVLDGLLALAVGWIGGRLPAGPELLALPVLVLYRHHRVLRWRAPSLLLCGCLLACLAAWSGLALLALAGWSSPWMTWPWPLVAAPLGGHLAAQARRCLAGRRACRLSGAGRAARLARRAFAATPGLSWRAAPAGMADVPVIALPPARFGDRGVLLALPDGQLPLYPEGPEEGMGYAVRRTLDVALALPALLLGAPLVALLALLTRLTSPGPAFHAHVRLTVDGRPFRIHKVRSMVRDAEPEGRPVWPEEGDPRITPLGRFMRRFWLDELPQLVDVLRGPMSLVGPRPERPPFVKEFSNLLPNYGLRHQVKAGMTGLSQVLGYTGNTSLRRRLHLDLRYVARWSPLLDVWLLLATGFRVLVRFKRDTGQ